jgi:hypothetical protein
VLVNPACLRDEHCSSRSSLLDTFRYDQKRQCCRSATGVVQIKGPEMGHLAQFFL